jgi:SAM-dependent methyltransferase
MVARVMESTNKRAYREALGAIDWPAAKHLFEIGHGTGDGLEMVRAAAPACRLGGIDFSALMHERARARLAGRGAPPALVCGDFLAADLAHGAYSHVLCVNVVYFWPRLREPFEKIWAMLEPGGVLVLFVRDEAYLEKKKLLASGVFHRHPVADLVRELGTAGFAVRERRSSEGVVLCAEKPTSAEQPTSHQA